MTHDDITRIHDKLDTITTSVHSIDTRLVRVETRLEALPEDGELTTRIETAVARCADSRPSRGPVRRWGLDDKTIGLIRWVVLALAAIGAGGGGYFLGQ